MKTPIPKERDFLIPHADANHQSMMCAMVSAIASSVAVLLLCNAVLPRQAPKLELQGASFFHLMQEHAAMEIQGSRIQSPTICLMAVRFNQGATNNIAITPDRDGILVDSAGRRYFGTVAVFPDTSRTAIFWAAPTLNPK